MSPKPPDIAFWSHVDRSGGPDACWPWTGCRDANGYGWLRWHGRRARAHRVALELAGRPLLPGQVGRHSLACTTKLCCNPAHLCAGSHGDNVRDCVAAGHHRSRPVIVGQPRQDLIRYYLHGMATSVELANLYGVGADLVRRIARKALAAA